MLQVKETKQHYTETTNHVSDFMNKCATDGIETEKGNYKINCCFLADQSCNWKVMGMRGACKVSTFFFTCVDVLLLIAQSTRLGYAGVKDVRTSKYVSVTITI